MTLIETRKTENLIRLKCYDYVHRFIHLACEQDSPPDYTPVLYFMNESDRNAQFIAQSSRLSQFKMTPTYKSFLDDATHLYQQRELNINMSATLDMMQSSDHNQLVYLFEDIERNIIQADRYGVLEFLSWFPQASGGLSILGFALLHVKWEIRRSSTYILSRLCFDDVNTQKPYFIIY